MSMPTPTTATLPLQRNISREREARAVRCRELIDSLDAEQIAAEFSPGFVKYLLVENGQVCLGNTAWYMERLCFRIDPHGLRPAAGRGHGGRHKDENADYGP